MSSYFVSFFSVGELRDVGGQNSCPQDNPQKNKHKKKYSQQTTKEKSEKYKI
jgi:hypothetical protein